MGKLLNDWLNKWGRIKFARGKLNNSERIKLCLQLGEHLRDNVNANHLPDFCTSLGLEGGDTSESNSSKRVYVRKRLEKLSESKLLDVATQIVEVYPAFGLLESVRMLRDQNGPQISDLTRRALVLVLENYVLFGDLHLVEELKKLWPIAEMQTPCLPHVKLEESVYQHCLRNEDWSNSFLLDQLNVIGCSRSLFFLFLEAVVSPEVRRGDAQKRLVEELNQHLRADGYHLQVIESISGYPVFKIFPVAGGVVGAPKNLIFAAIGEKPEIVLSDAINNDIRIVKNADKCLVYERPLGNDGLTKGQMIDWWQDRENLPDNIAARKSLWARLAKSLDSEGEKNIFKTYYQLFKDKGDNFPVLIPQVYLHYDPYTVKQLGGIKRLTRQRMDFLLLLRSAIRIVIEVDGKQHFADGEVASLPRYAEMMSADRDLRLAGYEIYRFGANELCGPRSTTLIEGFFTRLMKKHGW